MKLSDVKFSRSIALAESEAYIDSNKEVIFVGRSNVGKSSIMNALFQKKDLVKTSSRPGKTKTANVFVVSNKYNFTDLPGYGFAKLGKNLKEALDGLNSWYLEERIEQLKKVVILIDSKLGPQQSDIDMYGFIQELGLPVTIVLSKIDKIGKNELHKSVAFSQKTFFGQEIIPVSSTKKIGLRELEKSIKISLTS